jgi:hypothetical protein
MRRLLGVLITASKKIQASEGGGQGDRKAPCSCVISVIQEEAGTGPVRRFTREAGVAPGLDHPSILTVYDVGEVEGELMTANGRRLMLDEALKLALAD